jgi:hypothetical protein
VKVVQRAKFKLHDEEDGVANVADILANVVSKGEGWTAPRAVGLADRRLFVLVFVVVP